MAAAWPPARARPASAHIYLRRTTTPPASTAASVQLHRPHINTITATSTTPPPPPCSSTPTGRVRLPSAKDIPGLTMPSLYSSFPSLLHPLYEAVREECDPWILSVAQPPSASARRFLLDCLLPRLVCRCLPQVTSFSRLLHITKFISWLTLADDDDDHPDALGSDYAGTADRAKVIMAILSRGVHDREVPFASFLGSSHCTDTKSRDMLRALFHLWEEIRLGMPPSLGARFASTMADYFEGMKEQAAFRGKLGVPDEQTYMCIRRQASFTLPALVLGEYALGIELDQETYDDALIVELRNAAMDFICLCNDVISCPIEVGVGDYFNLPSIIYSYGMPIGPKACDANLATRPESNTRLALRSTSALGHTFTEHHQSMSLQDAIDYVGQRTRDINNHCISLVATIHEQRYTARHAMDPEVYMYVDALSLFMPGALSWLLESARYSQPRTRNELYQLARRARD